MEAHERADDAKIDASAVRTEDHLRKLLEECMRSADLARLREALSLAGPIKHLEVYTKAKNLAE